MGEGFQRWKERRNVVEGKVRWVFSLNIHMCMHFSCVSLCNLDGGCWFYFIFSLLSKEKLRIWLVFSDISNTIFTLKKKKKFTNKSRVLCGKKIKDFFIYIIVVLPRLFQFPSLFWLCYHINKIPITNIKC